MKASQILRENCAACRVSFHWLGNRKTLDQGQKVQAAETFGAHHSYLSASHKLMDNRHPAVQKLTKLRGEITSLWKTLTLPYTEPGVRLIKKDDITYFNACMESYKEGLKDAVWELNDALPSIVAEARQRLGDLFNEGDYPKSVHGMISVEWDFPSIEPPDYLAQIAPQVYEQEKARVAAKLEQAVALAEQAFLQELQELVSTLHERLTPGPDGQKKVFRDSAVENFTEFLDRFKKLNISEDSAVTELVGKAEGLIKGIEPKDLRDSAFLRKEIQQSMGQLKDALTPLVQNAPRRKIIKLVKEKAEVA